MRTRFRLIDGVPTLPLMGKTITVYPEDLIVFKRRYGDELYVDLLDGSPLRVVTIKWFTENFHDGHSNDSIYVFKSQVIKASALFTPV